MIPSNEPMRNDPAEAKINALLPELSKALATGLHDIEPGFEVLGQTLQTVYGDSETLTKGIMASVDTMTGKSDTSLLHHIGKAVNDSLSVLSGCSESIAGSLENITACSGYLTNLCTVCEKIKKNAGFLNIIGLNLSVEGGRTHETTEMFRDFGDEIKRLAGNMSQISTTIYENSDQIQKKTANRTDRYFRQHKNFRHPVRIHKTCHPADHGRAQNHWASGIPDIGKSRKPLPGDIQHCGRNCDVHPIS